MNSLDPSLAKYLSKSKQDIYDEYHGKKKKKSKGSKVVASDGTGLLIADDTGDSGWNGSSAWNGGSGVLVDDDDDRQPVVEHRSSGGFRPVASTSALPQPAEEAIPADEAPLVVGQVIEEAPTAGSSSAFASKRLKGGLQTSAQLKEENARRRQAAEDEREAAKARLAATAAGPSDATAAEQETVYRDKSGKKIDTKAAKAEAARQKRAEMEKEMQKMEWGKGLVQREDRERKRQEVEEMANRPFARHADDEDLNDSLKERERWNDPAARFLSDNKGDKKKSKGPSRPKYSGPAPPPNRFGILPGYRWDGADRSNGFERELVQASNRRKVKDAAARVYSTEDM